MSTLVTVEDIEAARAKIAPFLPVTPVTYGDALSERTGRSVWLKWDNKLRTGSFKERGALHFLLSLEESTRARGVIAASAGNHALGLTFHAHRLNVPCRLVMPINAPLVKVQACKKLGADITFEATLHDALTHAQEIAKAKNITFVPPYDHHNIVAGQGVAGLEILDQCHNFDSVILPIGGGGYAGGIATAIKSKRPKTYILGVCSEWAQNIRNTQVDQKKTPRIPPATIADGIGVKTIGAVTKPLLDKYIDKIITVSEAAIARAIIAYLEHEHTVVEGGGAAALAGLLAGELPAEFQKPLLAVSGSNIDVNLLSRLIEHDMADRGRLLRVNISLPDRPGALSSICEIIASGGANILQVLHDRFYAKIPGHVEVTIVMEVRDQDHSCSVTEALRSAGFPTVQM